jgi:hypothetical protein
MFACRSIRRLHCSALMSPRYQKRAAEGLQCPQRTILGSSQGLANPPPAISQRNVGQALYGMLNLEGCAQQRLIVGEEAIILASIPEGPASESDVIKKEKVRAMRLERSKLSEVADACREEEERRTFALFDSKNKGFISWEDLNRVMQQSGERWSSEVLDDMMMDVVPPGQERRVLLEMLQMMLRAPVCWDEREQYDCQRRLNESLEKVRIANEGSSRCAACCRLRGMRNTASRCCIL